MARLDSAEPGPADELGDGAGLAGPPPERHPARATAAQRELAEDGVDRLEPARARDQRRARLVARDLRRESRPLGLGHVREVGDDEVEGADVGQRAELEGDATREAEALGVLG